MSTHEQDAVLEVVTPLPGTVTDLAAVPDPVFSQALVGPGIAIDPPRNGEVTVTAPVGGTVAKVHPHAFVIAADAPGAAAGGQADPAGRAVLVHLGLDTVSLAGVGFTVHVTEGQHVDAGEAIVTWDPAAIEAGGLNPIVPVVALQATADAVTALAEPGAAVACGAPLLAWS